MLDRIEHAYADRPWLADENREAFRALLGIAQSFEGAKRLATAASLLALLAGMFAFLAAPLSVLHWVGIANREHRVPSSFLLSMLAVLGGFLVVQRMAQWLFLARAYLLAQLVLIMAVGLAGYESMKATPSGSRYLFALDALVLSAIVLAAGAARAFEVWVRWRLDEVSAGEEPDAAVAHIAAELLLTLRAAKSLRPADERALLAARVQRCGEIVEGGLAALLDPSGSSDTSTTLKRIAAGMRVEADRLRINAVGDWTKTITLLESVVLACVTGVWGGVSQVEPVALPAVPRRQRVAGGSILLARALAPLAVVVVIQHTEIAIHGGIRSYVVAGALLWAIASLVVAVDPAVDEKLAVMAKVRGLGSPVHRSRPS